MTIYHFSAISFLILTPLVSIILTKLFKLSAYGIKFPDVALPLFAIEMFLVSRYFLTHSFLPYYLIAMSLLALFTVIRELKTKGKFTYLPFIKFFWRMGFFVTVAVYLAVIVTIFLP